jgi:pyruvate dehydrogenase E2 component (dihydrolipoamide acetyltransferase)
MAEIVVMPKIGLTATEAELSGWLVEIGQTVTTGDLICEIETDKITNEVESPASGTLLKRVEAGISVPVGEPIAVLGSASEDVSSVRLYDAQEVVSRPADGGKAQATPTNAMRDDRGSTPSSPAARRRANELGLSLDQIPGTGPGGRITLEDVEAASRSTERRP